MHRLWSPVKRDLDPATLANKDHSAMTPEQEAELVEKLAVWAKAWPYYQCSDAVVDGIRALLSELTALQADIARKDAVRKEAVSVLWAWDSNSSRVIVPAMEALRAALQPLDGEPSI
jgi:hypothetical protein